MLLFGFLLSLDEGGLQEVESLVLDSLDVLFPLVPLAHLLLFHQLASQGEAGLVRCGRQRVLEGSLLPHLLDEVHLGHGGWQPFPESQVGNAQHLGHVVLVDDVLRRVWVGLRLRLSEQRLDLSNLGLWLLDPDLGRFDPLFLDLHHTVKIQK